MVEERLQDIYFEDVDDLSKVKYTELMDVDTELARLIEEPEGDKEWTALSDEAKRFLRSTRSEKTGKIYKRYFTLYTKHTRKKNLEVFTELSVIDFMLWCKDKYGKGTLWSIYSCINHQFITIKKVNLKSFTRLKIIMKRLTEGHVPRRSSVFTESQMKAVFEALDDDNLIELLEKIVISLLFYGMLRQNEVLLLQIKDVFAKDDGEVFVKLP